MPNYTVEIQAQVNINARTEEAAFQKMHETVTEIIENKLEATEGVTDTMMEITDVYETEY